MTLATERGVKFLAIGVPCSRCGRNLLRIFTKEATIFRLCKCGHYNIREIVEGRLQEVL